MAQAYSLELKEKVVAAARDGRKTYQQIGDENGGIHPTTIVRWVKKTEQEEAQKKTPTQKHATTSADLEQQAKLQFLYTKIGEMKVEIDCLRNLEREHAPVIANSPTKDKHLDSKKQPTLFGFFNLFKRKNNV